MYFLQSLKYWSDFVTMQKFVLKVVHLGVTLGVVLRDPNSDDMYASLNIQIVQDQVASTVGKW